MSTKRIVVWSLGALLIAGGILVYFFFDPSNESLSKFFPKCPIYSLIGLKCPGCGTQRALHDILNGDLVLAAHHNALLIVAIPLIVLYFIADLIKVRHPKLDNALNHPVTIVALLVVIVGWCVARNIFGW